ncbi:MAG: energy transducer TonB [Aphanocapsa sp. GSE-SYN-MK-11-07L]|nr:energy transducer TonB [Aphanocapsa sp. GSE-SYN-MK-11-07L]
MTSIIKILPDQPPQPNRLAIVVSVGFHALVFGALALAPKSPIPDDQKLVNLVTLSPEEQGRLPSFANPTAPTPGNSKAIAPPSSALAPPAVSNFDFSALPPLQMPDIPLPPPPVYVPPPEVYLPPARDYVVTQPRRDFSPPPLPETPPQPDVMESPVPPLPPEVLQPSPSPTAIPDVSPGRQVYFGEISQWFVQARATINSENIRPTLNAQAPPYPYPPAACQDKLQGRASVIALVSPEGKLVQPPKPEQGSEAAPVNTLKENPQIILSTKHELLDQAAIAAVEEIKFEPSKNYQALMYTFNYEYSDAVCAQAPQPSPSPQTSPSPGASSPEASPSPQPTSTVAPTLNGSPTPPEAEPTPSPSPETPPADSSSPADETPAPTPSAPEPEASPSPTFVPSRPLR